MVENENVVGNAQPTTKKVRRGVNNQTKAVANLKFHEKDAAANNLFVGHIEDVKVDWITNSEGKQFTGMKVPRLVIHCESNHINVSECRHIWRIINPVESNVLTIPGGTEEWKVTNIFNWIKHILDVFYLKGRELTEVEEEALSLPFEDFDENGQYIVVDPEVVLAGYATLFNNVASILNGSFNLKEGETAKPVFKSADGKILPIWIKLLRHKKRKGKWQNVGQNGELDFDNFIGNGVFEIMKPNTNPAILRVDLSTESITPKEVTPQTNNIIGTPNTGNVIVPGSTTMPMDNAAYVDAGSDMPF